MATYSSTRYSSNPQARSREGETMLFASVLSTAAFATSDIVNFFYVPAGFTALGVQLSSTDIDTNGTPTVTIDIGDSGDVDRLIAASTIGQAAGVTNTMARAGFGYLYTADTLIYATLNTVATGAIGTLKFALWGIVGNLG